MTIHIPDFGVDHLEEFAKQCNFPWLLSNVKDLLNNEPLANGKSYLMLEHAGIKVSVSQYKQFWF